MVLLVHYIMSVDLSEHFMVLNKLHVLSLIDLTILLLVFSSMKVLMILLSLFTRYSKKGYVLLLLYVDDMIISDDDSMDITSLKQFLHQQFGMKDLGPLQWF